MTISRLAFLMVAAAGLAAAQKIEITGQGIPNPCPAESYRWGVSSVTPVTVTGGAVSAKPQFSNLMVTRQVDKCSPMLFELCVTGRSIRSVTLIFYDSTGRTEIMQVTLTNVIVASVQHGANTASPTPTESVDFRFSKIEYAYYSSTGPVNASYDLTSNTGI